MLECGCPSVNDLVQNKFRSIIHLLSHHLLAQSHRQKHQMNVQDLLKVNKKNNKTEQSQWRHSCVLTLNSKHISLDALVCLVFLLLNLNS